jgi:DNA-binding MarR family transcriptional regulator
MSQASIIARPPASLATDHLNNRIFFRIFQVANVLQRQAVKQLGVTTVQWAVLGALSQGRFASGVHFGDLAEYLVVSRQNLDGVLKRLERDKLVERVTGANDRRARIVRLTPKGREFWDGLLLRIYQFYDQAAAGFKFDERVALAHYLNQLKKDLATISLPEPGIDNRRGK